MIKAIVLSTLCASLARASTEWPMEWKGQDAQAPAGVSVLRDAGSWVKLWARLGKKAPFLDFQRFVAVAVFIGERPTGGFSIEFLEPIETDAGLAVRYRVNSPTGIATQAFTRPWAVKAYPKPNGEISVEAAAP